LGDRGVTLLLAPLIYFVTVATIAQGSPGANRNFAVGMAAILLVLVGDGLLIGRAFA
jgi:hypothetical protein